MAMDFTDFETVFRTKVKGQSFSTGASHDGSLGHWLERQCGVNANSIAGADLDGFEIKSGGQKGSFGDWMAGWYIWFDSDVVASKDMFLEIFGSKKRIDKPNRFSWTGGNYGSRVSDYFTEFGQRMTVTDNEDIVIEYSYESDERTEKASIVPVELQQGLHVIAEWDRARISEFVENKFGQNGWVLFTVRTNQETKYVDSLLLGMPFTYSFWIREFNNGNIILDSGMNNENARNYSTFRAPKSWWVENCFKQIS
jgi:hypothetical protein